MSEHNKIDDLFKRNEAGLNREPSDSAWSKLDRMLPKEDDKAVVLSPLEERVKSFEKPNPRIVKSPIPTWVRYAALFALFSIPIAAFMAIQKNSTPTAVMAEAKKTTEDFSEVIAMQEVEKPKAFAIDGVALSKSNATGGNESEAVEEPEPIEQSAERVKKKKKSRFGSIEKIKQFNGNTGTTRPPVIERPQEAKEKPRLNSGKPLPPSPQAQSDDADADLPIDINSGIAVADEAQTEQGYPIVSGMPEGMAHINNDLNRQYKNPYPSADNLDKQYKYPNPSATDLSDKGDEPDQLGEEVEVDIAANDASSSSYFKADEELQETKLKKENGFSDDATRNDAPAISQSDGFLQNAFRGNDMRSSLNSTLLKYYGTWVDDKGINQYKIISTGPNTASIDVYRSDELSRNYQLVETADGISMMLYNNEANIGTTEYLVQSIDDKTIQFFLPSDPTNLVRFELRKKRLVVIEQESATESETFKLKKIE